MLEPSGMYQNCQKLAKCRKKTSSIKSMWEVWKRRELWLVGCLKEWWDQFPSILPHACVCVILLTNWWSLCLIRDVVSMLQHLEDPHITAGRILNPYYLRKSLMYSLLMFLKKWVCCQYKVQTGGCICLQWHNIKKLWRSCSHGFTPTVLW
jgi:hypothetical protein